MGLTIKLNILISTALVDLNAEAQNISVHMWLESKQNDFSTRSPYCGALKFQFIVTLGKLTDVQPKMLWHHKDQKELQKLPLGWSCLFSWQHCSLSCHPPFVAAQLFTCILYRYNNSRDVSHQFSAAVNFKLTLDVWFFTQPFIFFISLCKNVSEHRSVSQNYHETVRCNCTDNKTCDAAVILSALFIDRMNFVIFIFLGGQ